jgi:hypothetical protein
VGVLLYGEAVKTVVRIAVSIGLVLSLSGFMLFEKLFAPKADLWAFWDVSEAGDTTPIDNAVWTEFLQRYVTRSAENATSLAYDSVTTDDRQKLTQYVDYLSGLPVRSFNKNSQLSFWINLYNARTVLLILENAPIKSITEIKLSGGLFTFGPWGEKLMQIEGQAVSLNDIEHRILRPIWKDPRLHYALNCASRGCPNLQETAFTPQNTDYQLDRGAYDYINHPRGVRRDNQGVVLSKIYVWFVRDFGDDSAALFTHLSRYADEELKKLLKLRPTINGYEYSWKLNKTADN